MVESHARRWLAGLLACVAAFVLEDVLVCAFAGAPERAWGLVPLSSMRLGSFVACACMLAAASWLCAAGFPARWRARLGLFALVLLGLFLGNGRYLGSNDVAATRLVPFVLGREARLSFENSPNVPLVPGSLPYSFVRAGEHIVSRYPVATGVLALPAYAPALVGSYDPARERVQELERIAAALLALASVLIVAVIARRWVDDDFVALALAALYAFGTNTATVLSKALWQHTGGAFGFTLALAGLLLVTRPRSRWLLAGCGLGLAVVARSSNVAPALFVGLAVAVAHGWSVALRAGLVALGPIGAQLLYSLHYFGSIAGNGYGHEALDGWTGSGWFGLLASPGRGLLVYSPCLAFSAYALVRERVRIERRVAWLLAAAIASLWLVMGKWWCWWGGGSPGERMTSDITPIWGVGLALAHRHFAPLRGWRTAWLASCAYACAVHTLIAFAPPSSYVTEQFIRVMSGPWAAQAYAPLAYLLGFAGR